MTQLEEIRELIISYALKRGFTQERAEWLYAEFLDIKRIHGYPKAYQQVISRLIM